GVRAGLRPSSLQVLAGEGRGRPEQSRLRMGYHADRDAFHHPLVTALVAEALGKAASRQDVAEALAEPAGENHRAGPLGKRKVTAGAAERLAEALDRGAA